MVWSVRSDDGIGKSLEDVVKNVQRKVRPGAIILMHEGQTVARPLRVEAMRWVLISLHEQGYSCIVPNF